MTNWRYCIVPIENVTPKMAEYGHYTRINCMRKSTNNNVLVKWQGKKPDILKTYPEIDINQELKKPEWNNGE